MKKLLLIVAFAMLFLAGFGTGIVTDKIKRFSANSNWSVGFSWPCTLSFRRKSVDVNRPLERLLEVARKLGSPIHYDRQTCEFQILHPVQTDCGVSTGVYSMAYCPFTGRPLGSGRDFLFTEPTEQDVDQLWALVENAKDTNDITALLGNPNMSYGETEYFQAQYTYTNLSETAELIVIVDHDGRLSPIVSGKQIRSSVMRRDSNKVLEDIGTDVVR